LRRKIDFAVAAVASGLIEEKILVSSLTDDEKPIARTHEGKFSASACIDRSERVLD
jgi:hypothetical protein